jgi:hypothetical protein
MVVIMYAGTKGYLDRLNMFQQDPLQEISSDVLTKIAEKKVISEHFSPMTSTFRRHSATGFRLITVYCTNLAQEKMHTAAACISSSIATACLLIEINSLQACV